ncbi:hypothetical protein IAT38_001637 [Cryptococcus sp. DSM 104549]
MCKHDHSNGQITHRDDPDGPPDWEAIELPPDHILGHLTDAHCHPTDLTHSAEVYEAVQLGGLAAMATDMANQDKVRDLSETRPWLVDGHEEEREAATGDAGKDGRKRTGKGQNGGVGAVACFGYHPWFTHLYTLSPSSSPPSKEGHYTSLFLSPTADPDSKNAVLLRTLLPFLPEPTPLDGLLSKLKEDIQRSQAEGRMTMLGEVGLDGTSRVRWPWSARHLHPDYASEADGGKGKDIEVEEEDDWRRLTPFRIPMAHQKEVLERQMEVAVELGVNVSLHSVGCAGPTLDSLIALKEKHGTSFTGRVNVDVHSGGGWNPNFWAQAARFLPNLYASPSIFITGRSPTAAGLIRAIDKDRLLVESDSHDVRLSAQLVWAAVEWIGRVREWKVEGIDDGPEEGEEEWDGTESEDEEYDAKGRLVEQTAWTVRQLERNWARFMKVGQ